MILNILGISEKNPLFDEPEDVKNFILNDFTGYQADETLDNDFSSFVKVESEADSYLYSTVSIKEEGNSNYLNDCINYLNIIILLNFNPRTR